MLGAYFFYYLIYCNAIGVGDNNILLTKDFIDLSDKSVLFGMAFEETLSSFKHWVVVPLVSGNPVESQDKPVLKFLSGPFQAHHERTFCYT